MGNFNKKIDWDKVERLYRSGLSSVNLIAKQVGCSEANIRHKAKKMGWKKDLAQEVRTASRTKQVELLAGIFEEGEKKIKDLKDEQIIEEAARTQIEVVRQHQASLKNGHSLTLRLLEELDTTTCARGELEKILFAEVGPSRTKAAQAVLSLQTRSQVMLNLANASRIWVHLERQAFNIADDRDKDVKTIDDSKTADQLREEILKESEALGLTLDMEQGLGKAGNGKIH